MMATITANRSKALGLLAEGRLRLVLRNRALGVCSRGGVDASSLEIAQHCESPVRVRRRHVFDRAEAFRSGVMAAVPCVQRSFRLRRELDLVCDLQ